MGYREDVQDSTMVAALHALNALSESELSAFDWNNSPDRLKQQIIDFMEVASLLASTTYPVQPAQRIKDNILLKIKQAT